jgi:hypothetical protein
MSDTLIEESFYAIRRPNKAHWVSQLCAGAPHYYTHDVAEHAYRFATPEEAAYAIWLAVQRRIERFNRNRGNTDPENRYLPSSDSIMRAYLAHQVVHVTVRRAPEVNWMVV